MENIREIFLREINEFIKYSNDMPDMETLKAKYLELAKKYHPDVNNRIDKNILNEYMVIINNIFEKIMSGKIIRNDRTNIKSNNDFDFNTFCQLLKKITVMGINKYTVNDRIFTEYVNLLVLEIGKFSKEAGEAFSTVFLERNFLISGYKAKLLTDGLKSYLFLLTSVPPDANGILKNIFNPDISDMLSEKTGDSYLLEFRNSCKQKNSIDIIINTLKELHEKFRNN